MPSRDLKVTLVGEDRTGSAFGSAGGNADGLGAKFANLGKAAALGLAGMAVAAGVFAKSGVDAFARVEDAIGAANVQFGGASGDVVAFASKASTAFGLSKGAALDAANTFGTMGKAAGLSGTDLAKFSTDFTGLAGDMASFKGTSPDQAIEAIGAALRGETEPIRAYGVLLDDASMRQEALALGLISTTKDALTPQQKVLAAQSLIYKQTADAQGDFARTSDSTANTAKRLSAETENASARLGEQLAPAVTVVRELFLKLIKSVSGFVEYIGPGVATLMTAFQAFWAALREGDVTSDGLVGAFERVGDTLHRIGEAVMSVIGFFQQHNTAAWALAGVVGTVAALVGAAWVAQAAVSTINAAKSVIAWFTTATASTTSATIQSRSTAQIVVGWLAASAAAAWNAARVVASWVLMGAQAVVQGAVIAAVWTGQLVASAVAGAASFAVQAARVVAGWVLMGAQALIQAARMAAAWFIALGPIGWAIAAIIGVVALVVANWDTVVAWTKKAWTWVVDAVKTAVSFMVNLFLNFTLPGLIIKHWDTIKNAFSNGVSAAVNFVRELPGRVIAALGNLGSLLVSAGGDLIRGFINGIKNFAGNVAQAAMDVAKNAVNAVKGFLGIHSPSRVFMELGQNVGQGFANGISSMRPAVAAEMMAMANTQAIGGLGVARPSVGGLGGGTAPVSGAALGGGRAAIHIENYNEARQSPYEVAQDLTYLARTGG